MHTHHHTHTPRPYAPDWDPARFKATCRMAPNDYQVRSASNAGC